MKSSPSPKFLPPSSLNNFHWSTHAYQINFSYKFLNELTCEMLILEPLEPDTTIALKLLYSDKLFWALPPVLSRQSFRMRFTWFSKVCRSVLPGVGSSASLWAFSMTSITSCCKIANYQSKHLYIIYESNTISSRILITRTLSSKAC